MMSLQRIWTALTSVQSSITDVTRRRQGILLARVLIVLITLGAILSITQSYFSPEFLPVAKGVMAPAILVLVLAGYLNYRGNFNTASLITVFAVLSGVLGMFLKQPHDGINIAYLAVPLFLARIFFNRQFFILIVLLVIGITSISPWVIGTPLSLALTGVIVLSAYGLLFIIAREHREALERDKNAELAESESKLRAILDNMQDTYYRTDTDGRIVLASESATRLLGYSPNQVIGMRLANFYVDPNGREKFMNTLQAANGSIHNYEAELRHRDGSIIWVSTNAHYIFENDNIVGVEGTVRNISDRKHAEQALRESEERYRMIVETSVEGIWTIDAESNTTFVNKKMAEILGYSINEMIGKSLFDFMDDEGKRIAAANVERRKNNIAEQHDFKFIRKDGVPVWTELNSCPLINESSHYIGALAMVTDITEKLHVRQQLLESEEMLNKAQQVAHIGSWWWDIQSNQLICSSELLRIYGLPAQHSGSAAEMLELIDQRVHPDDREELRRIVSKSIETGKSADPFEYRIVKPDGTIRYVLTYPEVVTDDKGRSIYSYGALQDITERVLTEKALKESEARYRSLFENMTSGFALHEIICDENGNPVDYRYLQANPAFEKLTGVPIANIVGKRIKEILPNTEKYWIETFGKVALTGESLAYENFSRELGKYFDTWVFSPTKNQFAVIFTDITQRKLAQAETQKLSSAIEQTADAIMITDRTGIIEYVNPAFERSTGYRAKEVVGKNPRIIKSNKQSEDFYRQLWTTILRGEVFSDVMINRKKDGTFYYEEKTITPLKDSDGKITHFISTGKDVTERMQAQERMAFMAQHDALTHLPNRTLLLDRIKQSIARARWHSRLVAVLFIDLDRFKTINDTLGHEAGDQLLQQLGKRFNDSVREGDTVSRFGGDEFVILLGDVANSNDISLIAQKILDTLKAPIVIAGQNLHITASIGISLFPNDGELGNELLKNADIAMYRAKELGKNTYQYYSADMSVRALARLSLETSLRRALSQNEFILLYQPQIDMSNNTIFGVEALLRWKNPELGTVSPSDFISVLEETGLIIPTGEWVLREATRQLKQWHANGYKNLRLAVNLSPRQAQSIDLLTTVKQVLDEIPQSLNWLELEITEGLLIHQSTEMLEIFETLRTMGVRLAIDDFGTGYSSLSYLRRLPIDTLKIDRSFVRDIPDDPDDSAITNTIIAMAQSLRLEVIAEGVEKATQRDFLRKLGCQKMQGYLLSEPLSAEELTKLLAKSNMH